VTKTPTERELV